MHYKKRYQKKKELLPVDLDPEIWRETLDKTIAAIYAEPFMQEELELRAIEAKTNKKPSSTSAYHYFKIRTKEYYRNRYKKWRFIDLDKKIA